MCELFDKADTGGDGTISLEEYMVMCDEYGIELNEDHLKEVKGIANDNGEVRDAFQKKKSPYGGTLSQLGGEGVKTNFKMSLQKIPFY